MLKGHHGPIFKLFFVNFVQGLDCFIVFVRYVIGGNSIRVFSRFFEFIVGAVRVCFDFP